MIYWTRRQLLIERAERAEAATQTLREVEGRLQRAEQRVNLLRGALARRMEDAFYEGFSDAKSVEAAATLDEAAITALWNTSSSKALLETALEMLG